MTDRPTCWMCAEGAMADANEIERLRAMVRELQGAVRSALNMVDGKGAPPDWNALRDAYEKAKELVR